MPKVYKVTVDEAVHAKLVRQWDYIAQHAGASVAARYITRLLDYFRGLATFPQRGHPRPDMLPGLRVIGFGGEDYEGTLHEPPAAPYAS